MTAASLTGLLAFVLFVLAGFVFWGSGTSLVAVAVGLAMVGATGALICRATR
jgi:hypothetical protein